MKEPHIPKNNKKKNLGTFRQKYKMTNVVKLKRKGRAAKVKKNGHYKKKKKKKTKGSAVGGRGIRITFELR